MSGKEDRRFGKLPPEFQNKYGKPSQKGRGQACMARSFLSPQTAQQHSLAPGCSGLGQRTEQDTVRGTDEHSTFLWRAGAEVNEKENSPGPPVAAKIYFVWSPVNKTVWEETMERQNKSITGTCWQGCLLLSQQGRRLPSEGAQSF